MTIHTRTRKVVAIVAAVVAAAAVDSLWLPHVAAPGHNPL